MIKAELHKYKNILSFFIVKYICLYTFIQVYKLHVVLRCYRHLHWWMGDGK